MSVAHGFEIGAASSAVGRCIEHSVWFRDEPRWGRDVPVGVTKHRSLDGSDGIRSYPAARTETGVVAVVALSQRVAD